MEESFSMQPLQKLKPPSTRNSYSSENLDRKRSASLISLADNGTHQLTLERMLNPSVLFESIRDSHSGRISNSPAHNIGRIKKSGAPLMTLQQASRDGRADLVQKHIDLAGKDKKKLNRKDEEQSTALHYAVRYGHFNIVKQLIENGANVNVQGEYGASPLHYAARYMYKPPKVGTGTPIMSSSNTPKAPKKSKDPRKGLRNLMILNAQKRKLNLQKRQEKKSALAKKKNMSIHRGLRSIIDNLSSSNAALANHEIKFVNRLPQDTIHQSLADDLDKVEDLPLLSGDSEGDTPDILRRNTSISEGNINALSIELNKSQEGFEDTNIEYDKERSQKYSTTFSTTTETSRISENPEVVIIGTLSQEEVDEVDALILPQVNRLDENNILNQVVRQASSEPKLDEHLVSAETELKPMSKNNTFPSRQKQLQDNHMLRSRHHSLETSEIRSLGGKKVFHVRKAEPYYPLKKEKEEDSILLYLLRNRANPNMKDFYGLTPLHYAAMRGNVVAARQLLETKTNDLNIESKDRTKMTALHSAASNGSFDVCQVLLDHGAELRALDEEDMTPLHFAAMEGHLGIVLLFFRIGEERGGWSELAKMIMDQDRDEQTALHLAVENGHIDIVRACLDRGANVNFVKANLITPLHLACTSGQLEIVQILLQHEADIEAKNALQETPLHRAALFNRVTIVDFLLECAAVIDCRDKDKETPLMMAVRKNNVETVELLLSQNANVMAKDATDKTCLYIAAQEDCVETFQLLIEHPKVKFLLEEFDKNENTPLHIAAMRGYIKIVKMLLDMDACIDAKNDLNLTPLHLAAKHGRSRIVQMLLQQDVSIVNDEDDSSNTPLHLAALEGHFKVVQILLQCGAAVDARNATLWTPLDCAASRGWTWCAEALLDGDSPIDPIDKFKTTPLHLASKEGHVDMINLLLARKANITRKDHMGRNCLDWAIENNQRDAAMAIIGSQDWEAAMRNCTVEGSQITTPMRKLIKKLPEVAEQVFNQCIKGNGLPVEHPLYEISCNYEFLEDTFTDWGPSIYDYHELQVKYQNFAVQKNRPISPTKSTESSLWRKLRNKLSFAGYVKRMEIKHNHPLKFMVRSERTKLLCHPLVTYLLRHKWNICGRYFYYSKLLLYAIFLMFLTGYALSIATEKHLNSCSEDYRRYQKNLPFSNRTCQCVHVNPEPESVSRRFFVDFGRYMVLILGAFSIFIEITKLLTELYNYVRLHSLTECTSYILSIIYVLDSFHWGPNGQRFELFQNGRCNMWHRSLGAMSIWLSWLSLVLFMRKFPKLGIYVVMFTDILKTFAQFSMVFALFIIAFGLGFHMLLHEQKPVAFLTPARATLKTMMGMLGEFEYDSVFNSDEYDPMPVAWFIYVAYLVVNCIIVMNLLVGLAVDDIKEVQEQAGLKRLAMQVDLTLDVEKALPLQVQRRMVTMNESTHPNAAKGWSVFSFWSVKSVLSSSHSSQLTPIERVQREQGDLKETVRCLRLKMKIIEAQNNRMETMMTALLKHHQINVEYEVDKEEQK